MNNLSLCIFLFSISPPLLLSLYSLQRKKIHGILSGYLWLMWWSDDSHTHSSSHTLYKTCTTTTILQLVKLFFLYLTRKLTVICINNHWHVLLKTLSLTTSKSTFLTFQHTQAFGRNERMSCCYGNNKELVTTCNGSMQTNECLKIPTLFTI